MSAQIQPLQPSYGGPRFENAKVFDAMRVGVVTCRPTTTLRDVARIMLTYQIHAVVVTDISHEQGAPWSVISDFDIASAAASGALDQTAGEVDGSELPTINDDESLEQAAQTMVEHNVSRLLAVQPDTGQPVGVLSALALAAALAHGT